MNFQSEQPEKLDRRDRPDLARRAQWKIIQPPSLRYNEQAWKDGKERRGALLARRMRTIKMCSFDARSKGLRAVGDFPVWDGWRIYDMQKWEWLDSARREVANTG